MACATTLGRVVTMAYALFGIPLMLVVVNDMGQLWDAGLQKLRQKVVARWVEPSVTVILSMATICTAVDNTVNNNINHSYVQHNHIIKLLPIFCKILVGSLNCQSVSVDPFTCFHLITCLLAYTLSLDSHTLTSSWIPLGPSHSVTITPPNVQAD